jgi:hypothetical protein
MRVQITSREWNNYSSYNYAVTPMPTRDVQSNIQQNFTTTVQMYVPSYVVIANTSLLQTQVTPYLGTSTLLTSTTSPVKVIALAGNNTNFGVVLNFTTPSLVPGKIYRLTVSAGANIVVRQLNGGGGPPIATATSGGGNTAILTFGALGGPQQFSIMYVSSVGAKDFVLEQILLEEEIYTLQNTIVKVLSGEDDYRFGFNTQEKVNEIVGVGNHNTALFWEYDTRLGRRWNLDPKPQISISDYAINANNPIANTDFLGDFTSKFKANLANVITLGFLHGRRVPEQVDENGSASGSWYITPRKVNGRPGDPKNGLLPEVVAQSKFFSLKQIYKFADNNRGTSEDDDNNLGTFGAVVDALGIYSGSSSSIMGLHKKLAPVIKKFDKATDQLGKIDLLIDVTTYLRRPTVKNLSSLIATVTEEAITKSTPAGRVGKILVDMTFNFCDISKFKEKLLDKATTKIENYIDN